MIPHPANAKVLRAARTTLRRTTAAFTLDQACFDLEVINVPEGSIEIRLTYRPANGREPFEQRRELNTFWRSEASIARDARAAIDEMVWNAALAFRPAHAGPPTGWSIHPVAASIVAAAGGLPANPAEPTTWLQRDHGQLHLRDGGNIAGAVLTGREGVLLLNRATIVDANGGMLAKVSMEGPKLLVTLPGAYPETYIEALPGHAADVLCTVFAADPRASEAVILSAANCLLDPPSMVVELADRLVPLQSSIKGGERWRPQTSRAVFGAPGAGHTHWLGHSPDVVARHYARGTSFAQGAAAAAPGTSLRAAMQRVQARAPAWGSGAATSTSAIV